MLEDSFLKTVDTLSIQKDSNMQTITESEAVSPEDVSVVIPVLNEAEALGEVIDELRQEGFNNIIVIDGYSTDGTSDIAKRKGVKVIFQHGIGKAGAIKTAIDYVKTPYMLIMDGDCTYDPKDIKRMLLHAAKYDEVIGVRDSKNISWLHLIGNKILNFSFNFLLGAHLHDVCSGMYLVKTDALREVELKSSGFSVEVEIAAYMASFKKTSEVPISYRRRKGQRKLKSFSDGFKILRTIFWLARSYNPVFLLSSIASLLAIPGIALTIWQLYIRYLYGAEAWSMGVAWLGLFLLVIGLQGFTVATIALMLKRMEKRLTERFYQTV